MITMKPETLARRSLQRAKDRKERRADLEARLAYRAEQDPHGIWLELLESLPSED